MQAVSQFYDRRGVSRKKASRSPVFRIALDLGSRLGIAEGKIRAPDYRQELEELVINRFPSRTAFCEASGISPDMLSHVLAGRKDLSIDALSKALDRVGYRLGILPSAHAKTG
jgi:hypothetical protein